MRIILDTNILVSAIIQRSYPYFIVDRVFADSQLELCFSDALFSEYVEVLKRKKFSRFPDFYSRAKTLLIDIKAFGVRYQPTTKVDLLKDKADNRLLELAESSRSAYLVTGNFNDFTISEYKETKIVSPKDFFEILNQF